MKYDNIQSRGTVQQLTTMLIDCIYHDIPVAEEGKTFDQRETEILGKLETILDGLSELGVDAQDCFAINEKVIGCVLELEKLYIEIGLRYGLRLGIDIREQPLPTVNK